QKFKESHLLIQTHGDHQRLIAVPQIHAAPDGRFFDIFFFHPVIAVFRRHKILPFVFSVVHHDFSLLIFKTYERHEKKPSVPWLFSKRRKTVSLRGTTLIL